MRARWARWRAPGTRLAASGMRGIAPRGLLVDSSATPRGTFRRAATRRRQRRDAEEEDGMKRSVTKERRRTERVQARLQIELQLEPDGPSHASDTINISSNGVYF